MINSLGYQKPLFILPFDHRSSFEKEMFDVDEQTINAAQRQAIIDEKKIIYEGFKKAVSERIPKENAAILVDEEFGSDILLDAKKHSFNICLATEKSGQEEFDFEYQKDFKEHIEKFAPQFVKALIRFNPEGDKKVNDRQGEKLKTLSDYCHSRGYYFLLELLIPPTRAQLKRVNNKKEEYEKRIRPLLTLRAVEVLVEVGVKPDVWKIEGMQEKEDYQKLALKIREKEEKAGIIILGRGEDKELVEQWIKKGASVKEVIGFAIGRTIFWQPLLDFNKKKITREQAVDVISKDYQYFYDLFVEGRKL